PRRRGGRRSMSTTASPVPTAEAAAVAVATALEGLKGGKAGGARDEDKAALAGLLAAGELAGDLAEYWVALARAQLFAGEPPATVLETATKATTQCDAWAAAHNALGNAHLLLGDVPAATEAYRRAVELDRAYVAPRFNLGVLSLKAGDQAGAVQSFSAVLARAPDTPLAHMLRGQAYLKLGKRDDALADFEAEVERDSTNDRAWLLVGQVRKLKKDEPGALIAFCKAKELGAKEAAALCPDGAPK
ncbi:MAG: tetratricopeptide repeat protein, partial [Myxococcales bacterium]|nr:tetratricopeptide repeat protein [Myxococcales bacterium]